MRVTCFCKYCRAKAQKLGIDPERAHKGFLELVKFVEESRNGKRPVDGYFVTLWRSMLYYPELLAWEMLWTQSLRDTYAALHAKAKEIKPSLQVGRISGTTIPSAPSNAPNKTCRRLLPTPTS
jgi:hypothetical protein